MIIATQRDVAAATLDLDTVMRVICERTEELTDASAATIVLNEDDRFVHRAGTGFLGEQVGKQVPMENSFTAWVYEHGEPAICHDTRTDPRAHPLAAERGIVSMVCVPLTHGDDTIGFLQVVGSEPDAFGEEHMHTLSLLSVVLSSALGHASEFTSKRAEIEALGRFRIIFECAPIGMARWSLDGKLVEANPALQAMVGYTTDELAALRLSDYTHPHDVEADRMLLAQLTSGEREGYQLEKRFVGKDGGLIWSQVTAALERDSDGLPSFVIAMIENISVRKAAEDELRRQSALNEYQSLHDALTGLPNRTLFRDRVQQALLEFKRDKRPFAVVMMDLDRFKEINDALGHDAGDALLIEVSSRLQRVLRESDSVARLGGDEFALLLRNASNADEAAQVISRIREVMDAPIVLNDLPLGIEASLGVAFHPGDGEDVEVLVRHADAAMYKSKEENLPFAFYTDVDNRYDPTRLTLVGEIRRAMEERELVLYYQPKATLTTGDVDAVEALLRWNHPTRGLVPPDDFIPLVQQTGLMRPLTLYVIDEAVRQVAAWRESGRILSVSVNLTMRDLLDLGFPDRVRKILEAYGVPSSMLEFEITESTMLADPARTKLILEHLAAMGLRLSIDDFGTGYSSLSYLKSLPVDEIKIDRSFVMDMRTDEDDAAIVRSTIDLGRNLGLEVVAEGVESREVWDQLKSLGCTVAQGYYLSRPLPPEEFFAWLRGHGNETEPPSGELAQDAVQPSAA